MQCWYSRFEHIKNFKEFLRHLFSSKKGGWVHTCMYIYENTYSAFSLELLGGSSQNLAGMKYLWLRTNAVALLPDLPRGGSRAGKIKVAEGTLLWKTSSSDQIVTATNRMHRNDLKACGKKCCYFWFRSEVNFFMHFWHLFGLSHIGIFSCNFYGVLCSEVLNLDLLCAVNTTRVVCKAFMWKLVWLPSQSVTTWQMLDKVISVCCYMLRTWHKNDRS